MTIIKSQSWAPLLLCFVGLVLATAVVTAPPQATIKALEEQQIYLPATPTYVTAVVEFFSQPTQLNISHIEFKTISRQDYCQDDSSKNKYCDVSNTVMETSVPRYLHLVLLYQPPGCIKDSTAQMCDWTHLGVGSSNNNNPESKDDVCCTLKKQQAGQCQNLSRLILNPDKLIGQEQSLLVPSKVNKRFALGDHHRQQGHHQNQEQQQGLFDIPTAGEYAFLMANCNENGWDLLSLPRIIVKPTPSYLEGLIDYYASLTFYHFALCLTYVFAIVMAIQDKVLPIQKWLVATMAVAAFDILFKCIDYKYYWDAEPNDSWFNIYTLSVTMSVLKRGFSICIGVMVAKGWGMVCTSLGGSALAIAIFGFLYTGIVFVHDISNAIGEANLENESREQGADLTATEGTLGFVIFFMDIVFAIWILVSIRVTIVHLKSVGRYDQMPHHRILGCLLAVFMLAIAPAWIIQFVDKFEKSPTLTEEQWNYMNATVQGIYTITLTGIASLWIPKRKASNSQQEEAMEMKELNNVTDAYSDNLAPTGEEEDDEDEAIRPIDLDNDGNDPDYPNGLAVENGHLS